MQQQDHRMDRQLDLVDEEGQLPAPPKRSPISLSACRLECITLVDANGDRRCEGSASGTHRLILTSFISSHLFSQVPSGYRLTSARFLRSILHTTCCPEVDRQEPSKNTILLPKPEYSSSISYRVPASVNRFANFGSEMPVWVIP